MTGRPGCGAVVASAAEFLHPGTVLSERGTRIECRVRPWRIDSPQGRSWLGGYEGKLCDGVVGYLDGSDRARMVLLELKSSGAEVPNALEQIEATLGALAGPLGGCQLAIAAVVAFRGNAPRSKQLRDAVLRFKRTNRGLEPLVGSSVHVEEALPVQWRFARRDA